MKNLLLIIALLFCMSSNAQEYLTFNYSKYCVYYGEELYSCSDKIVDHVTVYPEDNIIHILTNEKHYEFDASQWRNSPYDKDVLEITLTEDIMMLLSKTYLIVIMKTGNKTETVTYTN